MDKPEVWQHGAVIRGPRGRREISLLFTGGDFGEGGMEILDTLDRRKTPGSFFFTGSFLRKPEFRRIARRAVEDGHYVGPHSDAHLLYCSWEERSRTLVSRSEFLEDLQANLRELREVGVQPESVSWWVPPYEWFNEEVADWAREVDYPLCSFTPGTLSHADYTEDDAPNYRSNAVIWQSILDRDAADPEGLDGFLLLTHVGAGHGRTEKFYLELDRLIVQLRERGYSFRHSIFK